MKVNTKNNHYVFGFKAFVKRGHCVFIDYVIVGGYTFYDHVLCHGH
jgi:hypothetical protein